MPNSSDRSSFRASSSFLKRWSRSLGTVFAFLCRIGELIEASGSAQTLPFLKVLVAACAHSRVLSNTTLANRLVRTAVPYLSKSILPRSETENVGAKDVGGSFKRKRKKRARGYEGDGVFNRKHHDPFLVRRAEKKTRVSFEGLGFS